MAQPPHVGEKSRDLGLWIRRRFESRQSGFDKFARQSRRAIGLGANPRAGVQEEQADAERQSQREHGAEQQRQAKAKGKPPKHGRFF